MNYELYIRETFKLANSAIRKGNSPFGAILVKDNKVFERAENTTKTDLDCTAHAEINLLKKAQNNLSSSDLSGFTLFSSTEPCAMCAGAIFFLELEK